MSFMNSTGRESTSVGIFRSENLRMAASDFRYLLNKGYPRKPTLELIGNRYGLTFDERHLLHRGIFSYSDSRSRRKKKITSRGVRNKNLAIDGHNVLITIEAGLSGRPLILGDDGFLRDISGLSGSFKKTETTEKAIRLIINTLKNIKPRKSLFLFDAPISMSGKLAQEIRGQLKREELLGDAIAVKVPETILIGFPGVVATSDTAIIDQSKKVLDLAGYILGKKTQLASLVRWGKNGGSFGRRGKG
jgi:hypothetical protein